MHTGYIYHREIIRFQGENIAHRTPQYYNTNSKRSKLLFEKNTYQIKSTDRHRNAWKNGGPIKMINSSKLF